MPNDQVKNFIIAFVVLSVWMTRNLNLLPKMKQFSHCGLRPWLFSPPGCSFLFTLKLMTAMEPATDTLLHSKFQCLIRRRIRQCNQRNRAVAIAGCGHLRTGRRANTMRPLIMALEVFRGENDNPDVLALCR